MLNVLSPLAFAAVLAAAPGHVPASGLAPTGVIVAKAGQVLRFDGAGPRQTLVTCEARRRYTLLVPPYEERSETLPCSFSSLVTHEASGRWAVSVAISERDDGESAEYLVNGKPLAVPARAGGDVFVFGDAHGVTGTSTGVRAAWYTDGVVRGQFLDGFSADGQWMLFTAVRSSGEDRQGLPGVRWQLSFEPSPTLAKAAPAASDQVRAKLVGVKGGVIVDGDDVFYYRKGKTFLQRVTSTVSLPQCDPAAPGTWRRLNRATGKDEELLADDWCTAATAPFVGETAAGGVVVINRLGQDRVRRLVRYDRASGHTTPIPTDALVKTPMAVSADGAFVLAWTYQAGLAMYETTTGARVWKSGALPTIGRDDGIDAAFVRDGAAPLAHPDRAFLGDGRSIPTGPGDPRLATSAKMKSFFERNAFSTAHVVAADGVHLAELSSMDQLDVVARIRSDVPGDGNGWSLLAAWPTTLESGEVAAISVTEGSSSGRCQPFSTTDVRGARVAFVDWRAGQPEVVACATAGDVKVRRSDDGRLELQLNVTFDDGSWARGFRFSLAPVP